MKEFQDSSRTRSMSSFSRTKIPRLVQQKCSEIEENSFRNNSTGKASIISKIESDEKLLTNPKKLSFNPSTRSINKIIDI